VMEELPVSLSPRELSTVVVPKKVSSGSRPAG
jgi:hypothetical protein